jgi:ubiquinone biosynthesis protein
MRLLPAELIPTRLVATVEKRPLEIVDAEPPAKLWLFTTIRILLRWLIGTLWLAVTGQLTQQLYARRLRDLFEKAGGLWIKVGQLLALRRDTFSPELCDELSGLLDQMKAFPTSVAKELIEQELAGAASDVFDEFIEEPFAAASIGQLYRAHLRREQVWVALKVQRPFIQTAFRNQMSVIRAILWLNDRLSIIPHFRSGEFLRELASVMDEEMDYRIEASNIRRMRKTLRRHQIYVPKVFSRYSTKRLLVMEYLEGVLMSDYINVLQSDPQKVALWQQENNVDPRLVARRLNDSILRQVNEDNLFHGDLHPGNILLLRNSGIAFLDFGSVGFLESEFLQKNTLFLRCIGEREYSKAVDVLFVICPFLPAIDIQQVKERLVRCLRAWETRTLTAGLPYHKKSMSGLHQDILKILYQYRIPAAWLLLKLDRAHVTLDASLMFLYPDMDYPKLIRRYVRRAKARLAQRARRTLTPAGSLANASSLLSLTPKLVHEYQMFQGPVLRRHAQIYQGWVTKLHAFTSAVFSDASQVLLLFGVFLAAVFLQQRHPALIEPLTGTTLQRLAARFPQLPDYFWIPLLALIAHIYRNLGAINGRLGKREARLPAAPRG